MIARAVGSLVLASALSVAQFPAQSDWSRADADIVRLAPARFADLPVLVKNELERRGCTIPQPFTASADRPQNVVRGRFISASSNDWAVLCSRQRRSSILVFRGGGVARVDELATEGDEGRLQVVSPGRIGYSRGISVASPNHILSHNPNADPPLPAIDHDGIDDAFIEKASTIWFWSGNRWRQLAGADIPHAR